MAPVYADHPYGFIADPRRVLADGEKYDIIDTIASEMACVHNMFTRTFNAVLLQAPHVAAGEARAFCSFAYELYHILHLHHRGEEEFVFPGIEQRAGEPGLMQGCVAQHEAFHAGLEAFGAYVRAVADGHETYDGAHLTGILESFGSTLHEHLVAEIKVLVDLRRFGIDKFSDLGELMDSEAQKNVKEAGFFTGLPYALSSVDYEFEGGRWSNFPPAPYFVILLIRYIGWQRHPSWWKFGPCDRYGRMKPLYAVPENKKA